MTRKFFEEQMSIIASNFGSTEYTKDRVAIIFEIVKDLPDENFKKIVRFFLETKSVKWPPLPSDFREAYYAQKKIINSEVRHIFKEDLPHPGLNRSKEVVEQIQNFLSRLNGNKQEKK